MIFNKQNIVTYLKIIINGKPRREIFKYIFRRLIGKRKNFDRDVFIKDGTIVLNCGRFMENCTVACGAFETEIKEKLSILSGTFIDVGAHIGKFSTYVSKNSQGKVKVISIEATPQTANLLKENIKINNCKNIKTYNLACSDTKGKLQFYVTEYHPATNSISKPDGNSNLVEINCDTLDNITKGVQDIKLIKIDVEGAELQVLKGGKNILKRDKPIILFEAWNKEKLSPLKIFLEKINYQVTALSEYNFIAIPKVNFVKG